MTRVHRITVIVVDHGDLGFECAAEIENARYPNDCVNPTVIAVETREVEWSDDHPLNVTARTREAAAALFGPERPA